MTVGSIMILWLNFRSYCKPLPDAFDCIKISNANQVFRHQWIDGAYFVDIFT